MPWKTWSEKQRAWSWREAISEGAYFVAIGIALIVGVVGTFVVLILGPAFLNR